MAAADSPAALEAMAQRRVGGEPLEYILGWAEFCGLRIAVAPGVFVPRQRTEFLVRSAVALAGDDPVILDLCCGAGAIAAALVDTLGPIEVHATDIDPVAIGCARLNLPAGASAYVGDLFEPLPDALRGRVRLLTANVPYVPTEDIALMPPEARLYERLDTLDGGGDGLDVLRRVAARAAEWLAPGGSLLVESSEQQAGTAVKIMSAAGLSARAAESEEFYATVVIGTA
jgi:release factor glutamine methyltransferase